MIPRPLLLKLAVACFLLSALALSCLGCASSRTIAPYAAMVAGNVADLATTDACLHRPGCSEKNAAAGSLLDPSRPGVTPAFVAAKVGTTAALGGAMVYLQTHGHPTAAKVLGYVDASAMFGIAWHNSTVAR